MYQQLQTWAFLTNSSTVAQNIVVDKNFVLHYFCAMKNVTITLEEEVVRWARIRAAEEDTSLSRLVGRMLRDTMNEEKMYRRSMHHFLAKSPQVLRNAGESYPSRDELHERQNFR